VLKLANKNLAQDVVNSPNSEDELCQSITNLKIYIESNAKTMKPMVAKSAYELGYYYFLTGNDTETHKYFLNFALDEMYIQPTIDFYFTAQEINSILKFSQNLDEDFENLTQDMVCDNNTQSFKMIDFYNEEKFIQNDFEIFLGKMAIDENSKFIFNVKYINKFRLILLMIQNY
jgi:hypothetical protein